jgi:hypothetical protein
LKLLRCNQVLILERMILCELMTDMVEINYE